jgi:hypothetical protein
MSLLMRLSRGTISLSSHASDGVAKATWLRRDVDVESCWHGVVEVIWSWRDNAVESC